MLPFRALESSRDPAITQAAYDALQSLRNGAPEAKKKIDDLAHAWVAGVHAARSGRGDVAPGAPKRPARGR